ncbi:magnesium/cobalt transporter CorA [Candidatus Palibaumannia cicadellinicola]|uniref:Magnesium transport protein CorA n=1 Tax=Baumannia cicadellinicola subsp. Homalodisca coagulata TaxID=374463 RepID=Q1LTW7_BAUCH|nr:magnesium/cobalt transporter CorA [Candidatus Baumannia cicadellinicola]ABF14297.1 magnesium and cobalt transport protein CorA [Baumannia cicadellinicola str. Hc (Homalodisca coagulata)]MBS0032654.1 magnesium/cobalt transporter CorA [Candidatus Baumannia cicadellinicola]MCJ7462421.1 magnesium/cobalt transporter CorA [Candidatus Baumannia cicadellinicola]MCJ7463047.1 magnesium/cobalt transporter CorA [Candidatus Baumannia cicadellinicola]
MLNAFELKNNRLSRFEIDQSGILVRSIWIDLVEPSNCERHRIQQELGQNLATRLELEDIEASARFFENEEGLHIHSFFFYADTEDHVGNATVAFTIHEDRLYTLRERELPAFRLYRMRTRSKIYIDYNAYALLLDLFETKIEQLADQTENIYSELEALSRVIMDNRQGDKYDQALATLAELEDIGWKVRLCLMDTQRALNFLVRKARLPTNQSDQAREILRDIESLLPHNESWFQKVNFLMQAAMGFINIEQNRIIKIFSVVSVIFLPPTLVASSYGMNFYFMPELKWSFGYPGAIILMILAGITPYLYFKRRNWL